MSSSSSISSNSTNSSNSSSTSTTTNSASSRTLSSSSSSQKSTSANSPSLEKEDKSHKSVPTPDFIAATETWRLHKGLIHDIAPSELPERLEEDVIRPFETLTDKQRLTELETILKSSKNTAIDPVCVRTKSNWATIENHNKFDNPEFDPKKTANELTYRSPKLSKILQNIRKFDREDEARYGRKFKHFIFSDIKTAQGAKAVAAALLSDGYTLGYNVKQISTKSKKHTVTKFKVTVKSEEELLETRGANFFLLSSVSVYGEPLLVSVKKEVLRKFNMRPGNVYGDLARIIVMDSGFKEGIDLFDIKYIHIFEPQTTMADQKQVIGRGTRTCGQKGLQFNPRIGWPLYIFKYDLSIDPKYRPDFHDAETAFQYYLQVKNIDIRLLNLVTNLENLAIRGSVDYELNKPIHNFSADERAKLSRGGDTSPSLEEETPEFMLPEDQLRVNLLQSDLPGERFKVFEEYIETHFSKNTWPPVKMENLCGYEGPPLPEMVERSLDILPPKNAAERRRTKTLGGKPNLITLSPTQEFISSYFTAKNPVKGMVLWQSVGTGKTCTAIATATRQFEPLGYTILWVTRTTLKNDIWKNMFDMVCHSDIRSKIEAGIQIPDDMPGRMRLLSKSWSVRPISYKQFSNLVSKNNQYYDQLVKKNGEVDPLRKTLLIIDEAHKLYGGGDLSSIERPDMNAFHSALMNSYAVSGEDSVRVLFMTATPITEDPLELVKLVNLCRPAEQQIPTVFEEFADRFLDNNGDFTEIGGKMFLDNIAGHISYLNREGDVRQFARPILREVLVPLVDGNTAKDIADFDVVGATTLDKRVEEVQTKVEDAKSRYDLSLSVFTKANASRVAKVCSKYPDEQQDTCRKIAKKYAGRMLKTAKLRAKVLKDELKAFMDELKAAKNVKTDTFRVVRQTRKDNEEDFEKYKKSTYYKLKECEKEWKDVPNLDKFLETQPIFARAKELENVINEELTNVEMRLKSNLLSEQSRIRSYNNLLKTDLTLDEVRVVRSSIADAKNRLNTMKKRNVKWLNNMTKRATASIEHLRKFQKKAKKEIAKVVKTQMQEEKKMVKEREKERKLEETADEELTEVFKESLKDAEESVRAEMAIKMGKYMEKLAKAEKANEKKVAALTRKQEKMREKEDKMREKEAKKEEKMREKEAKMAANATRKRQKKK